MRFGIRSKLIITLLAATGGVVACMYLVMQWSFNQGFTNYVNTQEGERYKQFASVLSHKFQTEEALLGLKDNQAGWKRILRSEFGPSHRSPPSGRPPFGPPPHFMNREHHRVGGPPHRRGGAPEPFLLDADKSVVLGRPEHIDRLSLFPIQVADTTIGYVGQIKGPKLTGKLDLLFVEQQTNAFFVISLAMVFISFFVALPISAHVVKPINRLSSGTQNLIQGHYDEKIEDERGDELGLLAKNFNILSNTLEENEQSRRRWSMDISHELRTPLAILKGEIEAMQDGTRAMTKEGIESLHEEVNLLTRLVEDLHQLSVSDAGSLNYQKQRIDAVEILKSALVSFKSDFDKKGIELTLDEQLASQAFILGDAVRIKQLFTNILNNSLRYTDILGQMRVTVELKTSDLNEDVVVIQFMDSSPGVHSDELDRLFERLYRVEHSRNRATGGSGLGLSICRSIVEAHFGTINAQHSPLGGVLITVTVPCIPYIS